VGVRRSVEVRPVEVKRVEARSVEEEDREGLGSNIVERWERNYGARWGMRTCGCRVKRGNRC